MTLDITAPLGDLLDGFQAVTAERTQTFRFVEWGKHYSQRVFSERVGAGEGMFTIREVSNPTRNADMGGGAALNVQQVDVMVWFSDGDDLSATGVSPTAMSRFRTAIVAAATARIRANEKAVTGSRFTQVVNVLRNADTLVGASDLATLNALVILTVQGEGDSVYA
ncbi:MAG: hypothetical protein LC623_05670 [Halobacteriales archaeon]|nr:hypothetical protein [Halobacteriales archaeon]